MILIISCCALWTSLLISNTRAECANFEFTNLNSTEFTAVVNTLVTLTFRVKYRDCDIRPNYRIYVYRKNSLMCRISFASGNCTEYPDIKLCLCEREPGLFSLNKSVDKEDSGIWQWAATNDSLESIAQAQITFNVIIPARITSLTLDGSEGPEITLRKRNVLVICSWENGEPTTTARLLHNLTLLNSSQASGNINYQFSACPQFNGDVIRCEADGSDRNASTKLFISEYCPVFLNSSIEAFPVMLGKKFIFTFSLLVHEPEQLQCYLNKTKPLGVDIETLSMNESNCSVVWSAGNTREYKLVTQQKLSKTQAPDGLQERCLCYFDGSPPNLNLVVTTHNDVTEQDSGRWRVTVSNRDGTDHHDFFVFVQTAENRYHGEGLNVTVIVLLGTIIAVFASFSLAYLMYLKKFHRKTLEPAVRTEISRESKSQHISISDIDFFNLLPIHKLDNSRDSGFLDINSLTAQE